MKTKIFSISFFVGVIMCFILTFVLVDNFVIPEGKPTSFKQFLLENVPGNKVMIYSGSNSHHGINPHILEDYFGRPVINLADTGPWPLEHKLYQVYKYGIHGDIVILPLEWLHYTDEGLLGYDYINGILDGRLSFYYESLPIYKKIEFILTKIPYSSYLEVIKINKFNNYEYVSRYMTYYDRFIIQRGSRGEEGNSNKREKLGPGVIGKTCDEYIFGDQIRNGWKISDRFMTNINLSKRIEKKGIKVIFTWPAVVGKDCYRTAISAKLDDFSRKIINYINDNGLVVLGKPEDSKFTENYFLNTYYHLTLDGMDIRTIKLLGRIKEAGLKPFPEKISPGEVNTHLRNKLNAIIADMEDKTQNELNEFDGRKLSVNSFGNYIFLRNGWYAKEKWGVWSQLDKSSLVFKLPRKHKGGIDVHFKGIYFNGQEKTVVFVNGEKLAEESLADATIHIPEKFFDGKLVVIELAHKNPISPLEIGKGPSTRKIKYGLISLAWHSSPYNAN